MGSKGMSAGIQKERYEKFQVIPCYEGALHALDTSTKNLTQIKSQINLAAVPLTSRKDQQPAISKTSTAGIPSVLEAFS